MDKTKRTEEFNEARSSLGLGLKIAFPTKPVPSIMKVIEKNVSPSVVAELLNEERWDIVNPVRFQEQAGEFFGVKKSGVLYYLPAIMVSVLYDFADHGGNLGLTMVSILRKDNPWGITTADLTEPQLILVRNFVKIMLDFGFVEKDELYAEELWHGLLSGSR